MDLKTAAEHIKLLGNELPSNPDNEERGDTFFSELLTSFKGDQTTHDTRLSGDPAIDIPTAIDNALDNGLNKGDLRYIRDLYDTLVAQGYTRTANAFRGAFLFEDDTPDFDADEAAKVLVAAKKDGIELQLPGEIANSENVADDLTTLERMTRDGWTAAALVYAQGILSRIKAILRELNLVPGHPHHQVYAAYERIATTLRRYISGAFDHKDFIENFRPSIIQTGADPY